MNRTLTARSSQARGVAGMILTALACNACCWLPPVLIAFGGASLGLAEFLHPYRPYLLVLMGIQLAWGFRNAYRTCDCCDHSHGASRRLRIGMMWGVAVVVVSLNLIPDRDSKVKSGSATKFAAEATSANTTR